MGALMSSCGQSPHTPKCSPGWAVGWGSTLRWAPWAHLPLLPMWFWVLLGEVSSCTRPISPPTCTKTEVSPGLGLARLCRSCFDFALRWAQQWAGASPSQPQPGWDAFSWAALMAVLILNVTTSGIPFPCFNNLQIIPRAESQNY